MSLQYLETLNKLGASAGTKFVVPMEFTSLVQPLMKRTTQSGNSSESITGKEK